MTLSITSPVTPPIILSIAGSDCSGGAGIQADIKTISALGGYAASVITAVTAQNTLGVQAVYPLPAPTVLTQIESVMDDLQPVAVKIGMVHDANIVHAIARCLREYHPRFIVYDPVMVSTGGQRLMTEETIQAVMEELFPLCTLITPNLGEASLLCGYPVSTIPDMELAAHELSSRFGTSVLLKGGHLEGDEMCDILCMKSSPDACRPHPSPDCLRYTDARIESRNLHGTGCTLSSAIATFLAHGIELPEAVRSAKAYISTAIANGKDMHLGQGSGPLWHFPLP